MGVKAPTGDDRATDYSYRATGPVLRPVDIAVQPGDGGWGILFSLQGFTKVYGNLFAYAEGSYLANPREENGVQRTTGDLLLQAPNADLGNIINSVPDQYLGRVGLSYAIWPEKGLSLSLGGRIEGIPIHDLIGGSDGFRRPGYAISIEPGFAISRGKNFFTFSAPVAVERRRDASIAQSRLHIKPFAAFADFLQGCSKVTGWVLLPSG